MFKGSPSQKEDDLDDILAGFESDDEEDEEIKNIGVYKDVINQLSAIFSIDEASDDPKQVENAVRNLLNQVRTSENEIKNLKSELDDLHVAFASKDAIEREAEGKKRDIEKVKEEIKAIKDSMTQIQQKLAETQKKQPQTSQIGDIDEIIKNQKDLEESINEVNARIEELEGQKQQLERKKADLTDQNRSFAPKYEQIRAKLNTQGDGPIKQLQSIQQKRKNIELALETLRASEAERNARAEQFSKIKQSELGEKANLLTKENEKIVKMIQNANKMQEDIARLRETNQRLKNEKERAQSEQPEVVKLNRDRISRLCAILVTDGIDSKVVEKVGQELLLSHKEIQHLVELTKVKEDISLGTEWDRCLASLTE